MSTITKITNNNDNFTAPAANQTLVFVIRHAQTAWNLERRFQGQLDVPLSAEGETQAASVADWLNSQHLHFASIYTSDLLRARQTAGPIGERLELEPRPVEALREIHAGEWQGLLTVEIEQRYPGQMVRWHREPHQFRIPGGETIPEVQARVVTWYGEAIRAHRGESIVVVSHGLAIRTLLVALNGWDLADADAMKAAAMGNTGVAVILSDHDSGLSSMLLLNSLRHLERATGMEAAGERTNEPTAV